MLRALIRSSLAASVCVQTWGYPHRPSYVQLPTGQYEGFHDEAASTTVYYGIPYGFAERFQAPRDIDTKPGLEPDRHIDASEHGPSCINFELPPPYNTGFKYLLGTEPIKPQSEDCLMLDVYVPDGDHKNLPVLFYTPGGGWLVGASFAYDMRSLVQRGAEQGTPFIAVAINYRLGPLGTLNPSTADNLNVGLLDQFAALKYVNKHITAFGGDPSKVTIMGESAGAESTIYQILWADDRLFRGAWLASVPSASAPFLQTAPHLKDDLIKKYARACGCPRTSSLKASIHCLSNADAEVLTNGSAAWQGSGPSLGGFMPENVFRRIRDGKFPDIPMVFSSCRDEGTSQAIGFNASTDKITSIAPLTIVNTAHRLSKVQGNRFVAETLEAYPDDPALGCPFDGRNTTYGQPSQFKRMAAIFTDMTYTEPWTEYLKTFSRKNNVWGLLWEEAIPDPKLDPAFGVQHGSDLIYYFPTLLSEKLDPRKTELAPVVARIQDALVRFVVDGDPNGKKPRKDDSCKWPEFGQTKRITRFTPDHEVVADDPPHRPGFDVLRKTFRPDGF